MWTCPKCKAQFFQKFYKVSNFTPTDFGLKFRITDEAFIDNEFRMYMKAAYNIGERKHIEEKKREKLGEKLAKKKNAL